VDERTILVVDDDADVRALTREVLEGAGYQVLEAGGGLAALTLAGTHPKTIHLVLTDVRMPGMSGPELVRRMIEVRPGVAVLYVSGHVPDPAALGGRPWLAKPFVGAELLAAVRRALAA
jgi:CheY-like chemotaxis protein